MRLYSLFLLLMLTVAALSGCGADGTRADSAPTDPNSVLMDNTRFIPEAVTIDAGSELTLKAETYAPHFIANGRWEQGRAEAAQEPNAPPADNIEIQGHSAGALGPFTTAGVYDYYCTIHPGMNLRVTVE